MYILAFFIFLTVFTSTISARTTSSEFNISNECSKNNFTICDLNTKTCICDISTHFFNSKIEKCSPLPTKLGNACEIDLHCQSLPDAVPNMSCLKKTNSDTEVGECKCSIGYIENDFKCEKINCVERPYICSEREYCDVNELLCKTKKRLGDQCESDAQCDLHNFEYCASTNLCSTIPEFDPIVNIFEDGDVCSNNTCPCNNPAQNYCKNGTCVSKIELGYLCDCPGQNECIGINAHCNNNTEFDYSLCECKEDYKQNPDFDSDSNVDSNCILKTCPLEKECDSETDYCDVYAGICRTLKSFNTVCNGSNECAGVEAQNIACVDRQSTGVMTCNCAIGFIPNLPINDENMRCIELVENKECSGTDVFGNEWTAFPGETKTRLCPGRQQGVVEWKCGVNGYNFIDEQPNFRNCSTEWVIKLDQKLQDLTSYDGSIYHVNGLQFLSDMSKSLNTAFIADGILAMDEDVEIQFFGHEIQNMIELLNVIAANVTMVTVEPTTELFTSTAETIESSTTDETANTTPPPPPNIPNTIVLSNNQLLNMMPNETLAAFTKVASDILQIMDTLLKFQKPWKQLANVNRTLTFSNVMNTIEGTSFRWGDFMDTETFDVTFNQKSFSVTAGVLQQFVYPINSGRKQGKDTFIELSFPNWENASAAIAEYIFVGIDVDINYVKKNMHPQIINMDDLKIETNKILNSNVVGITFNDPDILLNDGDVKAQITFLHDSDSWGESPVVLARKLHSSEKPRAVKGSTQCTRFDERQKIWTTDGCELLETRLHTSTCLCNQLGKYGLQAEYHHYEGKSSSLEGITITCYVVGIVLLGFSLYISDTSEASKVNEAKPVKLVGEIKPAMKAMMICLIINNFLLAFFVDKHYLYLDNGWCYFVGLLSHLFCLCSVMCLSINGIYNYLYYDAGDAAGNQKGIFDNIKTIVSNYPRIVCISYVVGIPIFIAMVIMIRGAVTGDKSYSYVYGGDFCWLDGDYIWALFAPGLVALIVNTFLCSMITRRNNHKLRSIKEEDKPLLLKQTACMKWNVVFSIVVGISWAVGYYQLGPNYSDSALTQYAFPVLICVQGILIFYFEMANKDIFQKMRKKIGRWANTKDKKQPNMKNQDLNRRIARGNENSNTSDAVGIPKINRTRIRTNEMSNDESDEIIYDNFQREQAYPTRGNRPNQNAPGRSNQSAPAPRSQHVNLQRPPGTSELASNC